MIFDSQKGPRDDPKKLIRPGTWITKEQAALEGKHLISITNARKMMKEKDNVKWLDQDGNVVDEEPCRKGAENLRKKTTPKKKMTVEVADEPTFTAFSGQIKKTEIHATES